MLPGPGPHLDHIPHQTKISSSQDYKVDIKRDYNKDYMVMRTSILSSSGPDPDPVQVHSWSIPGPFLVHSRSILSHSNLFQFKIRWWLIFSCLISASFSSSLYDVLNFECHLQSLVLDRTGGQLGFLGHLNSTNQILWVWLGIDWNDLRMDQEWAWTVSGSGLEL